MLPKLKSFFFGTERKALITGILIFCALAAAEFAMPNTLEIDIFYILPIFVLTWYRSRYAGLAVSLAGTAVWLLDERIFSPDFGAHPHRYLWNATIRLASFLPLVFYLDRIKGLLAVEKAVSRLKSSMIHAVSHEFNNALTGMFAALFLLQETEPEGSGETRSRLYLTISSAQHQLKLYVKNILNEARMEDGKFKLEKKPLALRELVTEAAASMGEMLKQKNISLRTAFPPGSALVDADRDALALVVSNLLGNAVKYTPQDGGITVQLAPFAGPPARILFSVEDTGHGMSMEEIKKITEGFYRTAEGKAMAAGFGLGLKITNELLALHGSRLEIMSEKGKGSRFFFELPALPPRDAAKPKSADAR